MITYFLKSATCLALLLVFYHFVLEKEKMHNFNRFYLLGSVLFSFLAPLYIIYIDVIPIILEVSQPVSAYNFTELTATEITIEKSINYTQIGIAIYLLISSILLIRFGRNFFKIIYKIRKNTKVTYKKARLVLVSDKILPHTFWNFIFINKNDYENQKIEQELFTHELTHVTQRHTLDVLILELIQIIFWINPFFILLKKAVQLNHEFLADETVIKQHKNTFQYQHLLLNTAAWKNEYYLASNLNYSLTKKRLLMMTTQSSQTKILLKKLAVIPLLTGSIFLFAERVEAQKITEVQEIIETIYEQEASKQKKLSDSEIYKEYFYKNLTTIRKDKNGKKIAKKYNELTKEEKARLVPPPPLKSKKKIPTQELIEQLKDGKEYAIWIDGKVVKNKILNNYKASDFSNYFVSFVYKNARSKRFPQEHQAHLSTHKYFENQNKKRVQEFKTYLTKNEQDKIRNTEFREEIEEKYEVNYRNEVNETEETKEIEEIIESSDKKDKITIFLKQNDEILVNNKICSIENLKSVLDKLQVNKNSDNLVVLIEDKTKIKQLTKVRIILREYGIKKINVKEADQKFNKNWFITINGQKYYYTFDKKERIARYYLNGKLVNLDIVEEYKKKHKIFEKLKASGKHYVFKPENEQTEIHREFSDLGGMYFRMPRADKNKVPYPENPIKPYVRLRKGDKIWYIKRDELTAEEKLLLPPPPPVPNATKEQILKARKAYSDWKKRTGNDLPIPPPPISPLDHVIKMAKKDATFYYEGNKITSDKAIELLKNNKNLNIDTQNKDSEKPIVKISKEPITIKKK